MGYSGVEFARGYEELPVEDVQKALEEAGVKAVSAHVAFEFMEQDLPYLAKLGVKFVACPMTAFNTAEEAKEVAEELNKFGQLAKQYGITIGYHNHTGEFYVDEGKYLMDWVIENTDLRPFVPSRSTAAGLPPRVSTLWSTFRSMPDALPLSISRRTAGSSARTSRSPGTPCAASQVRAG